MYSATLFSEVADFSLTHARYYLSKFRNLFRWGRSEDILEIGCCGGRVTTNVLYPFVKDHLNHLIASDIDEPAVNAANDSNNIANLSFEKIDITDERDCDKYERKFEHIFAFYVFHVIHSYDLWSKNVATMIKPNGQLFASIAQRPNLMTVSRAAQQRDKSKPWSKYIEGLPDFFADYGPKPVEMIGNILKRVGFEIDAINCERVMFEFKNMKAVEDVFLSSNNFLLHIPEELRKSYTDDYMERILPSVEISARVCRFPMDVVTVLATKTSSNDVC